MHCCGPRSLYVRAAVICVTALLTTAVPALAQAPDPAPASVTLPSQTDLTLINLPTTLSLESHHSYFHLTHRYARDILRGSLGEVAADLFGLDEAAIIGLEYRFGITSHLQAGVHRSILSKTIQTFARWDVVRQGNHRPLSVSLTASVEGLNNLREKRQPAAAITVSRVFGDILALYATPAYVNGTRVVDIIAGHEGHEIAIAGLDPHAHHRDTWFAGFGARVRFRPTGYIVGEFTPRLAGYDPNATAWGAAIEKRTGGHVLQLTFTNTFATTLGQIARGGNQGQILLGFNITRKF